MTEPLEQWLADEHRHAAAEMLKCVSARDVVKVRPGLGQTVRPVAGSIVASRVLGAYDPDPDYFFHWFRDSAIVIDAVRLLYETGELGAEALTHFVDFVRFSLSLGELDGRALTTSTLWRENVTPDFVQFLRGEDLAAVSGDTVYADTRVNPDGTLDVLRWNRPQHDGSALRALAVLRWLRTLAAGTPRAVSAFGARRRGAPAARRPRVHRGPLATSRRSTSGKTSSGHDYFTLRVSAAALRLGADWLREAGEVESAAALRDDARALLDWLDRFWLADTRLLPIAYHAARRVFDQNARHLGDPERPPLA